MKNNLITFLLFGVSVLSASAHPGHEIGAYGALHVGTSPYHLGTLAASGVIICCAGRYLRNQSSRWIAQFVGAATMLLAAVLWICRV